MDDINPPNKIHKYTTIDAAIRILSTEKFRWSNPRLFNDPFDPFIHPHNSSYEHLVASYQRSAVFCVSKRSDSVKMWSHYADQHKGILFGIRRDLFSKGLPERASFRKVEYISKAERAPSCFKLTPKFLHYKEEVWDDEEEWRFISPDLLQTSDIGVDSISYGCRDFSFDPEAIRVIWLGCRATPQDKNLLISLIENRRECHHILVIEKIAHELGLEDYRYWKADEGRFTGPCSVKDKAIWKILYSEAGYNDEEFEPALG